MTLKRDEIRSSCRGNGSALPLPLWERAGVRVLPQNALVEGIDFPPPAALFERVDLPRKRERCNRWSFEF